ncbi:SDR family oxidoreductase [Mucilaginibacter conchicola]|uniref:SDR family oxidoreductase n=1 Tax=Mucilaginibacter conchicola TaxID=2303333 RepID=A0A372NRU9_9SPHI|nr:SDR family oxidoreductase [Mucilaginibacter conchicola]RFZ91986.1 SDR family oxidoreductase [Mucilaginibacter conchicola]
MENTVNNLNGKRVIILGGSTGIGFATAQLAAQEGAEVVIVSSNQQRIDSALSQLPANATGFAVDLSIHQNIADFFDGIGKFDHLVYTAGENLKLNVIEETDIAQAQQFFNIRYWSAFAAVKYGAKHINAGGSITLTSGNAGARPSAGWGVASSICGCTEGFMRAMAVELAPVRVNCVTPGVVKTNLWGGIPEADREALYANMSNSLLVGRAGEAEDIALTYVYLMKQQYGTGQSLIVDGGGVLV